MAKYLRGNLAVFIYLQKFSTYTVYVSSSLSAYMTRTTVKVFQLMRFTAIYGKTSEGEFFHGFHSIMNLFLQIIALSIGNVVYKMLQ